MQLMHYINNKYYNSIRGWHPMNKFDNENEIRKDPIDFMEEGHGSDNNTELANKKVGKSQDVIEEIAMGNIRWKDSQTNTKRGRGTIGTVLIGAILGSAITMHAFLPDILSSKFILLKHLSAAQITINRVGGCLYSWLERQCLR